MRKFLPLIAVCAALPLAACGEGEVTEVEQPVVTDANDLGVDPVDTDVEAAPATGGAGVTAPGTEADVGAVGGNTLEPAGEEPVEAEDEEL